MAGKIDVYDFGGGGVNLVKNPLQLADNEMTSAQNAEYVSDGLTGGDGAMSKRGGIQPLTSALAGDVFGLLSLPLQTTYTRTLYASLATAAANTFVTTTNGTSWTPTSTPLAGTAWGTKWEGYAGLGARLQLITNRYASFSTKLVYPSDDYTQDTENPPLNFYDGTLALELTSIAPGPSGSGTAQRLIMDMLVANGKIYFSTLDSGGA